MTRRKVTFTRTSGAKPGVLAPLYEEKDPKTSDVPKAGDHAGWAGWWGTQALAAIRRVGTSEEFIDLDTLHAVRSTRLAFYHAARKLGYNYWDRMWTLDTLEAFERKAKQNNFEGVKILVDAGSKVK